jgi:hypothetical protein
MIHDRQVWIVEGRRGIPTMTSLEPAGDAVEVERVLRAVDQLGQRAIGGRV